MKAEQWVPHFQALCARYNWSFEHIDIRLPGWIRKLGELLAGCSEPLRVEVFLKAGQMSPHFSCVQTIDVGNRKITHFEFEENDTAPHGLCTTLAEALGAPAGYRGSLGIVFMRHMYLVVGEDFGNTGTSLWEDSVGRLRQVGLFVEKDELPKMPLVWWVTNVEEKSRKVREMKYTVVFSTQNLEGWKDQ